MMEKKIEELLKSGHQAEAIGCLEEYIQQNATDEECLLQLGELLYAEGKMTEALNKFNAVIRLNPKNRKAENYSLMIRNILGYYCKDLLNP
ncbi:MAG: tetratricopeptide repeat protein [Odoribacter sp.]